MTKQDILRALDELPDDASIEDAMEKLLFLTKLERARAQVASGETVSHEQARVRMSKWLR
ncbi:MAG TPA: hypothetical protein VJB57_01030 [Dehalococcoidia bacterium]|nr:hypothetical protein [Dehalococcoidia bacterium]